MPSLPRPLKLPPTGWTLAGLLAFYVLAGLFGHDPWKTEDVIHLAVARDFLEPEHGLGLSMAGQPFLAAPLYYWSAALTGQVLGALLPLHDALRLASGLWTGLTLIAIYYAGRNLYGQESAAASPLLLAGSFGLIVRAHEAQPMLVLLTSISLALLAVPLLWRKPWQGSLLLGLALSLAGLGSGLPGLLPLVLLSLILVLLSSPPFSTGTFANSGPMRRSQAAIDITLLSPPLRQVWLALGAAFLGSTLVLLVSALILYQLVPQWFLAWLARDWQQLQGNLRYLADTWSFLQLLPWFSWPLLPLAGWSLWLRRREWRDAPLLLPFIACIALLLLLPLSLSARETTAILLLPPLALLATPGALALRRGAANALDWFAGMAFSIFALLLWTGWSAMVWGWPERLARRAVELEPGFVGRFDAFFFALALLASLWWLWALLTLPRSPYRCLIRWSAGLTVSWLLAVSLWLPWIDYGKSYRSLAATLAAQMPERQGCIAAWHLGESQRASFAYFERLRFAPLDKAGHTTCRWLLVQGTSQKELLPPGRGWQRVWEGNRPGDRKERFRLYRRQE